VIERILAKTRVGLRESKGQGIVTDSRSVTPRVFESAVCLLVQALYAPIGSVFSGCWAYKDGGWMGLVPW